MMQSVIHRLRYREDRRSLHCLAGLAESEHDRKALFSEPAHAELRLTGGLLLESIEDAASLLEKKDETRIEAVIERHGEVLRLIEDATERYLERFYAKACQAETGPIFVDMLVNLKWISDHCHTIALNIAGLREV